MKKILPAILLLCASTFSSRAQETVPEDFGVWASVSIDKKISQKFGASFAEEVRTFDNASRIDQFFSNLGVNYKINRNFKVALTYRFINKSRDNMTYSKRHRLYTDISYRRKIYSFTLNYRIRLQGQIRDYSSSDKGKSIETLMRHKLDIKYSYKKFTPYVAAELFFEFNDPHFPAGNGLWNNSRYYIGSDYDLNKSSTIGAFFMMQQAMNTKSPSRDFVLGVEYQYSF